MSGFDKTESMHKYGQAVYEKSWHLCLNFIINLKIYIYLQKKKPYVSIHFFLAKKKVWKIHTKLSSITSV